MPALNRPQLKTPVSTGRRASVFTYSSSFGLFSSPQLSYAIMLVGIKYKRLSFTRNCGKLKLSSFNCCVPPPLSNNMNSWICCGVLFLTLAALSSAQLKEEEQAEILRAHNLFRGQVDPIATNMLELVRANLWWMYHVCHAKCLPVFCSYSV